MARIVAAIAARDPTPLLVDGPTGSGRTAVYAAAIAAALDGGRPALVLVPEIALALPLVDRLRADLGAEVAILHSGLGEGERADAWRRIRAGSVDVVVGTRLAVLAPFRELGLVIVDEEHDAAFKSDRTPRIQARDVALVLGRLAGAAVVLGSATPSVETEGRARDATYRRCTLTDRAAGAAPVVELVDLRAELAAGNRGLISERLATLIASLDPTVGEKAILVINRRGAASAVLCRDCGHVLACSECTRPLVYHQAGMTLRCHHCGAAAPMVARCPACGSPRIRFLGGGTQRLEAEVRTRFPGLRVGRLDRDVVERRGAAERLIDAFTEGRLDVLVGTTLVTKGLDVPEVTLVGIVSADVALTLPDERAAERTYQLLVQAIGRAGRGDRPGRAVVQTYQPEHPVIRAVVAGDPGSLLPRRAGASAALRRAALRAHREADGGRGGPGRGASGGRGHGRTPPRARHRDGLGRQRRRARPGLRAAARRTLALQPRAARPRPGGRAGWRPGSAMVGGRRPREPPVRAIAAGRRRNVPTGTWPVRRRDGKLANQPQGVLQ